MHRCTITLSDYNFADYLENSTAAYAPINFEQIVIVMIKWGAGGGVGGGGVD